MCRVCPNIYIIAHRFRSIDVFEHLSYLRKREVFVEFWKKNNVSSPFIVEPIYDKTNYSRRRRVIIGAVAACMMHIIIISL